MLKWLMFHHDCYQQFTSIRCYLSLACKLNFRKGNLISKRYWDYFQTNYVKSLLVVLQRIKNVKFFGNNRWFQWNDEPISVQQLTTKMKDFLSVDNELYLHRHMLQKLKELFFFGNIIVSKKDGMPHMVHCKNFP